MSTIGLSSGTQGQTQSQNQNPATAQIQSVALTGANQNSDAAQTSGAANDSAVNTANTPLQQNSTAALQFQLLQASLVVASQDSQAAFASGVSRSAPGQLLNISA